jgi:hypothetical protein
MSPTLPSGGPRRARLKFRLATKGKFIHRNRYRRRQILCCLHGEQHWLFMSSYGGGADAFLGRTTNDNWNGFRSAVHPAMLTVEQMHELAAAAPAGVVARVVRFRAGDVMMFDGRWCVAAPPVPVLCPAVDVLAELSPPCLVAVATGDTPADVPTRCPARAPVVCVRCLCVRCVSVCLCVVDDAL